MLAIGEGLAQVSQMIQPGGDDSIDSLLKNYACVSVLMDFRQLAMKSFEGALLGFCVRKGLEPVCKLYARLCRVAGASYSSLEVDEEPQKLISKMLVYKMK
jgi:hypothetical protein